MKLRYLLQYAETDRTRVFQCDSRGRQHLIEADQWKEHFSDEVESICARNFENKICSCILLRNGKPRFVRG